jgi:glyoxylate carboligase
MIAAAATALGGDDARAAAWAADVRARNPMLDRDDFFRAFPMQPQALKRRVSKALARLGF